MKCIRCGSERYVVRHHVKYKELHGVDEIIMLCRSCHTKLHQKLRREGKCNIPSNEIWTYSKRARNEYMIKNKIRHTYPKKKYIKKNERIEFNIKVDDGVYLREDYSYIERTSALYTSFYFRASGNKKLLYIDIEE